MGSKDKALKQKTGRVLDGTNQVAEYTYNGAGQRIKKVTQTETRIFHYDLRGHLIAETNQTGQMLAEYVYLGSQLLAMIRPGEVAYYYHNDHLGTPQVLTDDSQTIAWKAAYTPFGGAVASIQTVENPFRFPGQYYDQETGLHYNYFRYYNPQTGRYITPDPIGLEGGINLFAYVDSVGKPHSGTNLYAYTGNNPVNLVDPWGLDSIDPKTGKDNPVTRCHAVTHNDPAENLKGALILVGVAGGLTLGPEVPAIARSLYYWLTVTYLKDPTTYNNFLEGFLSPGPPSTIQGSYGSITRIGIVAAHDYWRTYYNAPVRNNPAECDPCH